MKYLKTFEKDVSDIGQYYLSRKETIEEPIVDADLLEKIIYDAIKNDWDFIRAGEANTYLHIGNGRKKRFIFEVKDDKFMLYYDGKKYPMTKADLTAYRGTIDLLLGEYVKDDFEMPMCLMRIKELKERRIIDNFWIEAAEKLGEDVVIKYLMKRDISLINRSRVGVGRKSRLILPRTMMMILQHEPSYYNKLKKYLTPAMIKKLPKSITRGAEAGLWSMKTESQEEETPSENDLFKKYYKELYFKKWPSELTIWKAYNEGFIDKDDVLEFTKNYTPGTCERLSDYVAIKFWQAGLITDQQFMFKFGDLVEHNGELKWYVDEIDELPGCYDSLVANILDDKADWEWKEWYNYPINDIWYNCNEDIKKMVLEYCYMREFEYEGEEYILKPNMVSWKYKNPYIKVGDDNVPLEDIIDGDYFEDIFGCLQRALNYAEEGAYIDAYYKEARRIISDEFGEYEQIKYGKKKRRDKQGKIYEYDRYIYVFSLNDLKNITDYIEEVSDNDDEDLEEDRYNSYKEAYIECIMEQRDNKKIDFGYNYMEGYVSYDIDEENFKEHIIDCFHTEGIEKEEIK